MLGFTVRRFLQFIFIVWAVSVLVFIIVRLLPGDPAQMMAGPNASTVQVDIIRESLGLDKPIHYQYWAFLKSALHGNLGVSYRYSRPVTEMVAEVYPITLRLALVSMGIALLIAIPLGILAAVYPDSLIDRFSLLLASFSQSMPTFFLGIVFLMIFSVKLRWFPALGYEGPKAIVLPAVTLAFGLIAMIIRVTRTSFIEAMRADYVRTARAKGMKRSHVLFGHVLPNAIMPMVTVIGLQFGYLLGGIVAIEMVFNWPGIGFAMVRAIQNRDFPVVQAIIVVVATTFVLTTFAVDIIYAVLDPRVRETVS
ncbi:MAG: ABC transporter permease [Anaerolineales bacterium]|nr:ABC transporter permease [Anaerolineales bacterium]